VALRPVVAATHHHAYHSYTPRIARRRPILTRNQTETNPDMNRRPFETARRRPGRYAPSATALSLYIYIRVSRRARASPHRPPSPGRPPPITSVRRRMPLDDRLNETGPTGTRPERWVRRVVAAAASHPHPAHGAPVVAGRMVHVRTPCVHLGGEIVKRGGGLAGVAHVSSTTAASTLQYGGPRAASRPRSWPGRGVFVLPVCV
jgi:hypothetical protein